MSDVVSFVFFIVVINSSVSKKTMHLKNAHHPPEIVIAREKFSDALVSQPTYGIGHPNRIRAAVVLIRQADDSRVGGSRVDIMTQQEPLQVTQVLDLFVAIGGQTQRKPHQRHKAPCASVK